MKVLVVDDDADMLDVTAYALRRDGFEVLLASSGKEGLERWQQNEPDVVVLDVVLPDMSGFEVCGHIRETGSTPVILLTALHEDGRVVTGFKAGADDYVTKPFSLAVLAARIRAVHRRGLDLATEDPAREEPARELSVGDLTLDLETHVANRGGQSVQLTRLEFRILQILMTNAGRVVTASRIVEFAWGYEEGDASLLKTHISNLRKKLRLPNQGAGAIVAQSGLGYRMLIDRT